MAFACLVRNKNTSVEPLVAQQKTIASLTVSLQHIYLKVRDCIVATRQPDAGSIIIKASYVKKNGVWEQSILS